MEDWLMREKMLLGEKAVDAIAGATVAVVGIGGVGGGAAEALCRAGVGHLIFMDYDVVDITNFNRQLVATTATLGQNKARAMAQRALLINPKIQVTVIEDCYGKDNRNILFDLSPDYIVDAIDSVPAKIDLIVQAKEKGIQIISAMGTGNKLDPSKLAITDIYKTSMCPLAKVVRKELRSAQVRRHTVLYSMEEPLEVAPVVQGGNIRHLPGTVSWVPPVAGMMMAGWVVRDIMKKMDDETEWTID